MALRDELGAAINRVMDQHPLTLEARWEGGSKSLEPSEAQAVVRLQVKIHELLGAAEAVDEAMRPPS